MRTLRTLALLALAAGLSAAPVGGASAQQSAASAAIMPAAPAMAAPKPPALPPVAAAADVPALPPLDQLEATRERPLFVRSRRPPPIAAPAPPSEAATKVVSSDEAPAELIGIVIGPQRTYAILKDHSTKEIQHLQKGEKIDDWSLDNIAARFVDLRRGATKIHLELFDQTEDKGKKTSRLEGDDETPRVRRPAIRRPPPNVRPRFARPEQRARQVPQRRGPRRPQRSD